jgi:sec-independent protein translocase protein TatB
MFDLSFFELMVVGVVALVVIGPEKLPKVARMLGTLTGRAQRYMAQVKEEVNREGRFSDLQDLQDEIKAGVDQAQNVMQREMGEVEEMLAKPETTPPVAKPKRKTTAKRKPRVRKYEDELVPDPLPPVEGGNEAAVSSTATVAKPKRAVRKKRVTKPTVNQT